MYKAGEKVILTEKGYKVPLLGVVTEVAEQADGSALYNVRTLAGNIMGWYESFELLPTDDYNIDHTRVLKRSSINVVNVLGDLVCYPYPLPNLGDALHDLHVNGMKVLKTEIDVGAELMKIIVERA